MSLLCTSHWPEFSHTAKLAAREARSSSFYSGQAFAPIKFNDSFTEEETESAIEEYLNVSAPKTK